jgi:hypothetical protein
MPKDFAGKNKTSKTYDKDWVLRRVKGPGGTSVMAWITKKQDKENRQGEKEAKAYRASLNAPATPATPTPPTTAPILTAPVPTTPTVPVPTTPAPQTPQEPAPQTQIPSWWINQAITNPTDPNQQFANVANALLPTLAPEDQRTLASYLATNFKDVYGKYANVNFGAAPTQMTDAIRKQYLSPQRAQMALDLLNKMKTASGAKDMGAGYQFLTNAVGLINQFLNPNGVLGRENYNQFTTAVSNLVGQAGSNKDLAAYANLAQLFNLPKFTAGPLINNTPNSKLFS